MTYRQLDTQTFEDGAVTLYRRSDHRNPRWYFRLKLLGVPTCKPQSTKTADFHRAKTIAMCEYYRLLSKQQNAEPLFPKKFKDVAEAFLAHQCYRNSILDRGGHKGLSDGRLHYQDNVVRRWFIPYFGEWHIDRITTTKVDEFWEWRIGYWKTEEGKAEQRKRRKSVAVDPASTTLNEEKISLKQVFNFAVEKGWLGRNAKPFVRLPIKVTPVSREPFTEAEWRKLYGYIINDWLKTAPTPEKFRARRRVQARVIVSKMTGMRPPEASNLRWRDVGRIPLTLIPA